MGFTVEVVADDPVFAVGSESMFFDPVGSMAYIQVRLVCDCESNIQVVALLCDGAFEPWNFVWFLWNLGS